MKQHFKGICHGEVERFELPNLGALNFLLHESLGGGGTLSLMTDAQGKTFSTALLADGDRDHRADSRKPRIYADRNEINRSLFG